MPADGVDAVETAGLGFIALAGGNNLSVPCFQTKAKLPGLILNLLLGMGQGFKIRLGLVLHMDSAVFLYALHTLQTGIFTGAAFAGGNYLPVRGDQVEPPTALHLFDNNFPAMTCPPFRSLLYNPDIRARYRGALPALRYF